MNENDPAPSAYRDEDWEEDPPRVVPGADEPRQSCRRRWEADPEEEISASHTRMLAELTREAHDFAMDYFETARGIDDRVAGRSCKIAIACKLATLTSQLIAASDKHKKETGGS